MKASNKILSTIIAIFFAYGVAGNRAELNRCKNDCHGLDSVYVKCRNDEKISLFSKNLIGKNRCCELACEDSCQNYHCKETCRNQCKSFGSTNKDLPPPSQAPPSDFGGTIKPIIAQRTLANPKHKNITTEIHIKNVVTNNQIINKTIDVNTTTFNNLTFEIPIQENCCYITGPKICNFTEKFPFYQCVRFRWKECGPKCASKSNFPPNYLPSAPASACPYHGFPPVGHDGFSQPTFDPCLGQTDHGMYHLCRQRYPAFQGYPSPNNFQSSPVPWQQAYYGTPPYSQWPGNAPPSLYSSQLPWNNHDMYNREPDVNVITIPFNGIGKESPGSSDFGP